MEKVFLIMAEDQLEAYLIEAILKKNDISSNIQLIPQVGKRKYKKASDKANLFVDKDDYEKALELMEVIKKERQVKEENIEEKRLFSKKQLFFAIITSSIFLLLIIWVVVYAMK